jgi:MFS family permease
LPSLASSTAIYRTWTTNISSHSSGKAYGMFNVKWLHIGSVLIFTVGSAICGAAPTMTALIVGRVIAGIGGAGLYLGMLNLIAINTLESERPAYMGGTGVVWGAGTILGPVIGGAFADSSATWRWVCSFLLY